MPAYEVVVEEAGTIQVNVSGGEANNATNVGVGGVGVFKQKVGPNLEFKNINAGSAKITVTADVPNNEIDVDLGAVALGDLSNVDTTGQSAGNVLAFDGAQWVPAGDTGEANTASNVGINGLGLFKQKTGVDLEFRNIDAGSGKITVTLDAPSNTVDIDVDETNINHDLLTNYTANDHVDHTTVSILAGTGLTGGGDITTSRTLSLNASVDDLNDVVITTPLNGQVLKYNGTNWINNTDTDTGESNTASNVNAGGVGVFKQKVGVNLEFRGINAASSKVTVVLDVANNEVDVDIVEANINHDALSGFVANKHIDHTTVSISAGTGLTGGGDISANRTLSLTATTADRALVSNGTGYPTAATTTATEIGYVNGVTSSIQTQLDNKQGLDATLTALAAYTTDGIVVHTGVDTFAGRTIVAGSSKVSVANGSGVAGNPSIDVTEANLTLNNIGGTLGISKGGTGQTTATAAFDALSPDTTKGDLIVSNGTNAVRLAVGTNTFVLTADSVEATGVKWAAAPATYTDEQAQDAVGTILTDTATINLTYTDGTPSITADVITNSIGNTFLRDSSALSVIGRSANSTGDPADIAAANDHEVLRRSGTTLAFGAINLAQAAAVTGALAIANGGTGQTAQTAAFDALAPTTTKGDLIVHNGTDNIRVAIGTNTHVLMADTSQASGVKWATPLGDNPVLSGTGSVTVPSGTTGQRTTAADAVLRYNTDEDIYEGAVGYPAGSFASYAGLARSMSYRKRRYWVDEFLTGGPTGSFSATQGTVGDMGWCAGNTGTPVAWTYPTATTDHNGIVQMTTGTSSGNQSRIYGNGAPTSLGVMSDQVEYFAALVYIPDNTSISVKFGIGENITDAVNATFGTAGVWFEFLPASHANWRFYTRSASSSSTPTSTVAVNAATWYLLEAFFDGTTWTPRVNGTNYTGISTNVPAVATNVGFLCVTNTNATRTLNVDYFAMTSREMGVRY